MRSIPSFLCWLLATSGPATAACGQYEAAWRQVAAEVTLLNLGQELPKVDSDDVGTMRVVQLMFLLEAQKVEMIDPVPAETVERFEALDRWRDCLTVTLKERESFQKEQDLYDAFLPADWLTEVRRRVKEAR